MDIYLFRHGSAPMKNYVDFDRQLDERGRSEVIFSAQLLKDIEFDMMISSPLVRAQQTIELIKATTGWRSELNTWSEASPDSEPCALLNRLEQLDAKHVLIVSHQPLVSYMIELLSDERLFMETASVVGIRMDVVAAGCGHIFFRELR